MSRHLVRMTPVFGRTCAISVSPTIRGLSRLSRGVLPRSSGRRGGDPAGRCAPERRLRPHRARPREPPGADLRESVREPLSRNRSAPETPRTRETSRRGQSWPAGTTAVRASPALDPAAAADRPQRGIGHFEFGAKGRVPPFRSAGRESRRSGGAVVGRRDLLPRRNPT